MGHMAKYSIMYWQEIPSLVEARAGRDKAKRQLSERFQELIDMAAMRRKLDGSDDYLLHWRKGDWQERDGSADQVVSAVGAEIEAEFESIKKAVLDITA